MYTHPIEDENCKNILNSIIFEKAISLTSAFGAVFRVKINHELFALKVIGDTQLGRNELKILCTIKKEILDENLTPCFVRCDNWIVCQRIPEVDSFGPSSLENYSREHPHLYFFLNVADYSLYGFPYEMTQYEIKCIIFELLYALYVARKVLKFQHSNVTRDNILILEINIDRVYTIGSNKFRSSSKYLPLWIDFNTSSINEMNSSDESNDVHEIIDLFGHFINEKVDLSDSFVSAFEDLALKTEKDKGRYDITSLPLILFSSDFFFDLDVKSTISQRLSNKEFVQLDVV